MRILLAILSLLIVQALHSQTIPKGVNTIIVSGTSLQIVAKALIDTGFAIEKSDSGKITTKPREYVDIKQPEKTKLYHLIMIIRLKDSTATITGIYDYQIIQNNLFAPTAQAYNIGNYITVSNSESSSSYMRQSFNHMVTFAKTLNGLISYEKRELKKGQ
jgi:hypothetical protein